MSNLAVAISQINPQLGNISYNYKQIRSSITKAISQDADILVTPELSLIGYPPMDLLRREELYSTQQNYLDKICDCTIDEDIYVLVGFCRRTSTGLYNSAAIIRNGTIVDVYDKQLLPTYDVFDGDRYFNAGTNNTTFSVNNEKIAVTICEDAWYDTSIQDVRRHSINPFNKISQDTTTIINMSASPYRIRKNTERVELFCTHATETDTKIIFCNQVGGNDELVFDGNSFIIDSTGNSYGLSEFQEDFQVITTLNSTQSDLYSEQYIHTLKDAILTGIHDYVEKTGFEQVIVGMSGGIDSSLATALCVDAVGSDNVIGVTLPSAVTSEKSVMDAKQVATNLGIEFVEIPIQQSTNVIEQSVKSHSRYEFTDIAMQNIQARVRGDILMSLANITDSLVVTPDNKSESAIGYCTLYGDTVGAIAPLGDCYKKYVYNMAHLYDSIPQSIIEKQPSAELTENQIDTDDMPKYEILDEILDTYIEQNTPCANIQCSTDEDVANIISRIHTAEFKRDQSPIPIRVSEKDLSRGWRYPITGDYDFLLDNHTSEI